MCMSWSARTSFAVRSDSNSNSDSDSEATYVVSSISSEEDKDRAHGQEVCQICVDSTPATSPFLCVEGALDFLQNAECEYYGSYGYTIYGSQDLLI